MIIQTSPSTLSSRFTVRAACDGKLEIGQECGGESYAVYVRSENALMLVGAILRAAGMGDIRLYRPEHGGYCDVDIPDGKSCNEELLDEAEPKIAEPQPKDRTAAERQRRYRERQRNGHDVTDESITSNGENVTEELPLRLIAAE